MQQELTRGLRINTKPCNSVVSGVDNKSHLCTSIGDLPITVCNERGAAVNVTIKNVRCVPSFTDSLISIRQLWLESKVDVRFGDQCEFLTSSGVRLPFVPANKNLFIWRAARGHAPLRTSTSTAVSNIDDGKSFFIHSNKSISHVASLHPDLAATHLHRGGDSISGSSVCNRCLASPPMHQIILLESASQLVPTV